MTTQQIETAFKEAVETPEFNKLELSKYNRYDLRHKPCTTARKLEILWMLDKLQLK